MGDDKTSLCTECKRRLPHREMASFGDRWTCSDCKSGRVQRVREGCLNDESPRFADVDLIREKQGRELDLRWKIRGNLISCIWPLLYFILALIPIIITIAELVNTGLMPNYRPLLIVEGTFAIIFLATFIAFLPLSNGNLSLRRRFCPDPGQFLVEVAFHPRLRTGLEAVLDSADDFGLLEVTDDGFQFRGDGFDIMMPFSHIDTCQVTRSEWRGPLMGGRLEISTSFEALGFTSLTVDVREGKTIIGTRRANRGLQSMAMGAWEAYRAR
jgi:hypothetical protein